MKVRPVMNRSYDGSIRKAQRKGIVFDRFEAKQWDELPLGLIQMSWTGKTERGH